MEIRFSEFRKPGTDMIRLKQEIYGVAALDTKRMIPKEITDSARRLCRPPTFKAVHKNGEFVEDLEGDFCFWQELAFTSTYYVGVDPSLGAIGAALGAIVAIDAKTGAVVATAGFREMNSIDLAAMTLALCQKLCGPRGQGYAQVVPESTGIGGVFLTELKRLRWTNVFMHNGVSLGMPNIDRGEKLLTEYGRALRDGDTIAMDHRIVDDLEHFEYDQQIKLVFTGLVGHGDLGQAAALAWWGARERRKSVLDAENKPWNKGKHPIELEPGYVSGKRGLKKSGWSARFALRN